MIAHYLLGILGIIVLLGMWIFVQNISSTKVDKSEDRLSDNMKCDFKWEGCTALNNLKDNNTQVGAFKHE